MNVFGFARFGISRVLLDDAELLTFLPVFICICDADLWFRQRRWSSVRGYSAVWLTGGGRGAKRWSLLLRSHFYSSSRSAIE